MGFLKVRRTTAGIGVSGYLTGSLAFSIRCSRVSLISTIRFGQGSTTFRPGMIRWKVFRPVLRSMNVRPSFSLSMTTLHFPLGCLCGGRRGSFVISSHFLRYFRGSSHTRRRSEYSSGYCTFCASGSSGNRILSGIFCDSFC